MPEHNTEAPNRLERLVRQARWVLGFERTWPSVVAAAALLAGFVALSWTGFWLDVPRPVRVFGVALLLFGLGMVVLAVRRAARVSRRAALKRLDRDSGLPHRPVTSLEDQIANAGEDPATRALWDIHRRRLDAALARVRLAPPAPRTARRDPYALRALALLTLVAAGFAAGPDKLALIASAFDWRGTGSAEPAFRVDAWLDPPPYTGKPPVILFAPAQPGPRPQSVTVPVRSTLIVRSSGAGALGVEVEGGLRPVEPKPQGATPPAAGPHAGPDDRTAAAPPAGPGAPAERRFTLTGPAHLHLAHGGHEIGTVAIEALPDQAPTIALVGRPRPGARGTLTLDYAINDDYGVTGADASFSDPTLEGAKVPGRSLVPPPKLALGLPPTPGGLGTASTSGDLSDHPWAGAEVAMVLTARDEGGNVGMSEPSRVVLPRRPFSKPLARALVEQRQALDFDPDHHQPVIDALDALMIAPDRFGTTPGVYLGLHTARERLATARTDDDLIGVSDLLWEMALQIEDGDLSQAQRDLRAAEQALKEALDRGAPPEEVKRLTEALRQQMEQFLAEMMRQDPQSAQDSQPNPNARMVTPKDLQQMLQRMQKMAQSGNLAEAQRMLDQLQSLLENLKSAHNGQANQAQREMNRSMSELDRMTRDQQALRDKTFRKGEQSRRRQHGPQQNASPPPQGSPGDQDDDEAGPSDPGQDQQAQSGQEQPSAEDLQRQQQDLAQRLQGLQDRLRDLGMKGEKGLDDAGQAMTEAQEALGQGPSGNRRAVDAQGRALDGLQKGADGLGQQMAQGQGDQPGEGEGQGSQPGQGQGMANGSDTDPLGRRRDSKGGLETRGQEIGEGVAARAARVLQELRRRLADPNRPQDETDYLERLLRPY